MALARLGFDRHIVVFFVPRSAIERFFGDVEHRIKEFWNGFSGGYSRERMERRVSTFAGFRNYMKCLKRL